MYLLNTYLNTGVQRAGGDCICKKGGTLQTLLLSIPDEPAETVHHHLLLQFYKLCREPDHIISRNSRRL